ncbi:MAG: hypothetical protein KDK25_05955 [Leptospiraceae bacterium]|nr:hypothetical protein [Leptospiraceae bacterium]
MAARMFKWLGGSFLISLMLLVGMVPAGYFVYRDGAEMVQEVQKQAKSRASQLTVALGAQASEATSSEALVALCETMKQLVQDSQASARGFIVEEAFLIDLEGRVLAHNDVARVAKDSGITYSEEKYQEVLMNARRYPMDLEVIGRTDYRPDAPLVALLPFLEKYLPDLRANRFHVAYAVYLPDADVPSGSLHVFLRNEGINNILDLYWQNVLQTFTYSIIAYLALTLILSILLALTIFGGRKDAPRMMAPATTNAGADAAWGLEEGAFEDRSADLEEAGFSEKASFNSSGNESGEAEAASVPMQSNVETSDWPSFPGHPGHAGQPGSVPHPSRTGGVAANQRSHTMDDPRYEAPRVIDRDILDAIPLENGERK